MKKHTRGFGKKYFTLKAITMHAVSFVLCGVDSSFIYYKKSKEKLYTNKDPPELRILF